MLYYYDDEAKESKDVEAEEEEDEEDESPKKKKPKSFNFTKFGENMETNFDDDEMALMDVVVEYCFKKFEELKKNGVEVSKLQVRNPFVQSQSVPPSFFVSQQY